MVVLGVKKEPGHSVETSEQGKPDCSPNGQANREER